MYNIYAIVILILIDIPLFFGQFSIPILSRCCTKIPEVGKTNRYQYCVNASSGNMFKNIIDRYLIRMKKLLDSR